MSLSSSSAQHKENAKQLAPIQVAVITVSDTRDASTDENGLYLKEEIIKHKCSLSSYTVIKDEVEEVESALNAAAREAQVIVINGGTGIAKRDRTFDVVDRKLTKTLPGFGEIFRHLSYNEIGSASMLSRATAGVYNDTIVFSLPGSTNAVKLAWEKLIVPEMAHLVWELAR